MLLRPVNNNSKSLNARQQAINYPTKSSQAITAVDTLGNLSALSFPTGFILIWYPPDTKNSTLALVADTVPVGWAMCDGTQGTPDLRGRFVLMAADESNGSNGSDPHTIGQKGGEETHVLSGIEMPKHTHIDGGNGIPLRVALTDDGRRGIVSQIGNNWAGDNQPHNNMPPFYSLIYVMKL